MARVESILQRDVADSINNVATDDLERMIADSVGNAVYGGVYPDEAEVTSSVQPGRTKRLLEAKVLIDGEVPHPDGGEWYRTESGLYVTPERIEADNLDVESGQLATELSVAELQAHNFQIAKLAVRGILYHPLWRTYSPFADRIRAIGKQNLVGVVVFANPSAAWQSTDE